jgi:hypothetical protein
VKLTLDRMCITSGKLCNTCEERFDKGEISQIDIDVGNTLLNIAKSQRFLSDITVLRIIETSKSIYIITKKGDAIKLEQAGEHLENQLLRIKNKKFTYFDKTKNAKKLLSDLLTPVIPVGNSTVILPPDGDKELKVQIKKSDKEKLNIQSDELSRITSALLGMNCHYSYV